MTRFSNRRPGRGRADFARRCMVVTTVMIAVAGCQTAGDERPQTVAATAEVAIEKADPRLSDLAEKAIAQGRYGDARSLLGRVLLADAEDARARLLMAELHLATGSSEMAVGEFDELADDPEVSARALQGKGIALMRIGDNAVAYDSLRQAVDIDPTQWRAWNALGYYHDSRLDWSAADESYKHALAANPESALVYNNRGFSRLIRRRFDEAVEDLTKALELDPDLEATRVNLRLVLAWRGRYGRAMLGVYEKETGKALNNVGFIALLRGDYSTAESYFLRALESDASFNKVAWRNLGYLKHLLEIETGETAAGR